MFQLFDFFIGELIGLYKILDLTFGLFGHKNGRIGSFLAAVCLIVERKGGDTFCFNDIRYAVVAFKEFLESVTVLVFSNDDTGVMRTRLCKAVLVSLVRL